MRQNRKKRQLAALLTAAVLLATSMPVHVLAVEQSGTATGKDTGLCKHHAVHTAECGYFAAGGVHPARINIRMNAIKP